MANNYRAKRLVQRWSAGAAFAAAAAAMGAGAAHADTPDDVLGQAITNLNAGTSVLESAPTSDLASNQAADLANQEMLGPQLDPILRQLGSAQEGLSAADQTYLATADEQFVTAAQNLLSADQGFVAADQAGSLDTNTLVPADLTSVHADLGLLSADLHVLGATVFAAFGPSIGTAQVASAAAATAEPTDSLSEATTNLTDANQLLGQIDVSGVNEVAFPEFINAATLSQDLALQQIGTLETAEGTITSYDGGILASLVTPLFTDIDQQWYQASDAALAADQGLQAAVVSESGLNAAQFASLLADSQLFADAFHSLPIDFAASLLSS